MSVSKRVFIVGFGPGFDSMSPARSWCSASHDAGLHDWLPKKTGGLGLRRGRISWIQFAQSLLTVAHQPRAGCIRLVPGAGIITDIRHNITFTTTDRGCNAACARYFLSRDRISHVVSPSKYCHFFRGSLLHV